MREKDEKPSDEARSHSVGFLKKAARMAKKTGGKRKKGRKAGRR
jgi:hypothetical protein